MTPRRTLAGLALAATAAVALAVPAIGVAGVAAVQDDVLATAPLDAIPGRILQVQQTKAKVTRVDILWSLVAPKPPFAAADPNDPAYDWSRLDAIFTGLAAARITPIVSVYSTPDWAVAGRNVPHPTTVYNPNAPTTAAFGAFMRAVATRYSGTFVPAPVVAPAPPTTTPAPPVFLGPLPRVRHFEIWNEPNLKSFFRFNSGSSLARYKGILKAGYTAIKAVNSRAIVIGGVGGPRSSTGSGNLGAKGWMTGLVNDRSVKFDAYSQHNYPSRAPLFFTPSYAKAFPTWASLPEIYTTLDKKKKGMKLYVTEAGYTTGSTNFRTVRVSLAKQALYLRQLFSLPDVKSTQLAAVVWFNLQDNKDWPGGLLRASGVAKPSYAAFRSVASRPIPAKLRAELAP
jgi:hypothetical protein